MKPEKLTLGIDANGGDWIGGHPSKRVIKAVSLFQKDYESIDFVIFGNEKKMTQFMEQGTDYFARFRGKFSLDYSRTKIIHAPAYFSSPRRTKEFPEDKEEKDIENTSTYKMIKALKEGSIDCALSMADTGSLIFQGIKEIGMMPNLEMKVPLLFQKIPTVVKNKQTLWGDLGGDKNAKPEYVFEYAWLLTIYAEKVLGWNRPTIKILNNGTEIHKGSDFEKEVVQKIYGFNRAYNHEFGVEQRINLDYKNPYVEGDQILFHGADIILNDGRIGNVALKATEGAIKFLKKKTKESLNVLYLLKEFDINEFSVDGLMKAPEKIMDVVFTMPSTIGYPFILLSRNYRRNKAEMDPQRYNGAPLLGLNNYLVKMHGNSNALGIYSAINSAVAYRKSNAIDVIQTMPINSAHFGNGIPRDLEEYF